MAVRAQRGKIKIVNKKQDNVNDSTVLNEEKVGKQETADKTKEKVDEKVESIEIFLSKTYIKDYNKKIPVQKFEKILSKEECDILSNFNEIIEEISEKTQNIIKKIYENYNGERIDLPISFIYAYEKDIIIDYFTKKYPEMLKKNEDEKEKILEDLYKIYDYIFYVPRSKDYLLNLLNNTNSFDIPSMDVVRQSYQIQMQYINQGPKVSKSITPCIRCGSLKVLYSEKQTRSADEPMTITFRCTSCVKTWKIN
jgi:DNA-directed RNA polymerase subunit M/transcription elongation factor TFIIS